MNGLFAIFEGVQLEKSVLDSQKTILTAVITVSKQRLLRNKDLEEFIIRKLTLYDLLTKELAKVQEEIQESNRSIFEKGRFVARLQPIQDLNESDISEETEIYDDDPKIVIQ